MVRKIKLPSHKYLNECFSYNRKTGDLLWKNRPDYHFEDEHISKESRAKAFNKKYSRKVVGSYKPTKYKYTTIKSRKVYVHRIIWKLVNNEEPNVIDHINGNPSDNRIENLINTDQNSNIRNCKLSSNNNSGGNGIQVCGKSGLWVSSISHKRTTIYLGKYKHFIEAKAARNAAEKVLNFSDRHGEE